MEEKIINLFAYHPSLTFTDIKKILNIQSNYLSYWLSKLIKKGILKKSEKSYSLTETSEHLIPYISENKSTLPVILVQIGDSSLTFLVKRTKRPYKSLLSLPGGRLLVGESIENAAKRILKVKYNIEIGKVRIKSISLEHLKKKNKIFNSFLLILVTANTKSPINMINIEKNKKKIIQSDYELIKSSQSSKIKTIISKYV